MIFGIRSGVKLTPEPGCMIRKLRMRSMDVCVRQIYVSPSVGSKINTRTRAQASMNSILLRWAPSLNIRSKLKGPCKHKINRSNTFLIPGLSFHSLSLKNLSPDTVPLKERG